MPLADPLGSLLPGGASAFKRAGPSALEQLGLSGGARGSSGARPSPGSPGGPEDPLARNDAVAYHTALLSAVEPPYYTGAQVQVIIGTTFMLNAIDLTWNQNYEHTPYFGYRSTEYDYAFGGKTMVQGALILNLLDNRLLDLVCDRAYPPAADKSAADTVSAALAGGKQYAGIQLDRLLSEKARTGFGGELPGFLDQVQAVSALRTLSSPAAGGGDAGAAGAGPPARSALNTLRWLKSRERFGIELRCNIGDPTELGLPWASRRASVYETVRGVIFTGENRALRVSTEVIAQAYTFFARGVDRSPR